MPRMIVYTYESDPSEVVQSARNLSATLHKLYGGDRVETGAVGIGPTAQRWLRENGPPTTTGYCAPVIDEATKEVRIIMLDDAQERLTRDGNERLTVQDRTAVAQAIAEAVDRVRPNPGGAGGLGRDNTGGAGREPHAR